MGIEITEQGIITLVSENLNKNEIKGAIIYRDKQLIKKHSQVHAGRKTIPVSFNAYMVFVDLEPQSNWGHACLYIFIQEDGERYEIKKETFPPYYGEYPETWIVILRYGKKPPHEKYFQNY